MKEIDLDKVLQHTYSASTSHLFGKTGSLPPQDAVVERRYVKFWSVSGENDADFVALDKRNSATKGVFEEHGLTEGEYKLVCKLVRTQNMLEYATAPFGAIIGGVNALVVPPEKREGTLARGMPTEYVDVHMIVKTDKYMIMDQKTELDNGNDTFIRVFTVRRNETATFSLKLQSYSLVKRMRIQATIFRCDLPPPSVTASRAAAGRRLVQNALSSGNETNSKPPKPSKAPIPPKQPHSKKKDKRRVQIKSTIPIEKVLEKFYSQYAPEKVSQIPAIIDYFLTRDQDLGVLFATLEDKYGVTFDSNGHWK